jgi:CMD domain protein
VTDTPDVIDELAGIAPGSRLAELRAQRPEIARYAQASYEALLAPPDAGGVSQAERELVALRVAGLARDTTLAEWHRERLRDLGVGDATIAAVERFPDGQPLPPRETALLRFTDRVTRAPAASTREQLDELAAAGFGPREVVTIGQLVGFLSFQVRALAGLRLLGEDA